MKKAMYLLYVIIVPARVLNIPRFPTTSVELWLPAARVPLQKIWLFYKTSEKHHKSDI